ncbi:hypothetical protein GN155_017715 [Alcanivorax sp. ZXX171]|nr:hypothetical protein [Alcanivorax sp. ZXX171]
MATPNPSPQIGTAALPVAMSGAIIMGLPIDMWLLLMNIGYVAIVTVIALPKLIRAITDLRVMWADWRKRR